MLPPDHSGKEAEVFWVERADRPQGAFQHIGASDKERESHYTEPPLRLRV